MSILAARTLYIQKVCATYTRVRTGTPARNYYITSLRAQKGGGMLLQRPLRALAQAPPRSRTGPSALSHRPRRALAQAPPRSRTGPAALSHRPRRALAQAPPRSRTGPAALSHRPRRALAQAPPRSRTGPAALSHRPPALFHTTFKLIVEGEHGPSVTASYLLSGFSCIFGWRRIAVTSQKWRDADEFEKYCSDIANTSAWGGQLELRALSHILQTPIEVIQADSPPIVIGEEYASKPITLMSADTLVDPLLDEGLPNNLPGLWDLWQNYQRPLQMIHATCLWVGRAL
ncbi:deubiquitinase OTUD6B isoform X5 [Ascaphus truei]|uniref:deubiquitinase OTUD6B isoform X5 n=1 Tax=Ascaphus truei TaxID=8439 RepID=UPI003F590999